jgi:outer membrane protein TolC
MKNSSKMWMIAATLPLFLGGCISNNDAGSYSYIEAGFATVEENTSQAISKQTVWVQSQEQAEELTKRVHNMVFKKSINVETAVQLALLNNKGLQASYAEIGISAAQAWQQTMLENPKVSIGVLGIAHPELSVFRAIEGMIATNILALSTRNRRIDIADTRFRQAQLKAVLETLKVAGQTRAAWINAVSAFETLFYLNQGQLTADAASELAKKLGESGALPKAGQARHHVFYSELTGQKAQARLAAKMAKENLTKLLGLWGSDLNYFVPDSLPRLPRKLLTKNSIEADALQKRVDLQIAKLELEAVAKSFGLTQATRYVTDFEIIGGFEKERELGEEEKVETLTTPQIELEFVIPIFDTGKARMRKAELAYMRAANLLAEKAINIRSDARSSYVSYRSNYDIARHYRNAVLPLRAKIAGESLLTYNGMITNTFELLQDTRAKINAALQSVTAKKEFWLAGANLVAAIYGGGASASAEGGEVALADNSGGH